MTFPRCSSSVRDSLPLSRPQALIPPPFPPSIPAPRVRRARRNLGGLICSLSPPPFSFFSAEESRVRFICRARDSIPALCRTRFPEISRTLKTIGANRGRNYALIHSRSLIIMRSEHRAQVRSQSAASATYAFIIQETTAALEKFLTPNRRETPRATVKV